MLGWLSLISSDPLNVDEGLKKNYLVSTKIGDQFNCFILFTDKEIINTHFQENYCKEGT